jgi:hypothetical protein
MKNSLVKTHTRKRKNGVTVVKKHKRNMTASNAFPASGVKTGAGTTSSKAPMTMERPTKKGTVKKVASIKSTMKSNSSHKSKK